MLPEAYATRPNSLFSGIHYFVKGVHLMMHPRLRRFVLVPLAVNIFIFVILTSLFIGYFSDLTGWFNDVLPTWLSALAWIISIVIGILLFLIYGYSFNIITTIIAAPFYGILAEKTENLLTGGSVEDEPLMKLVPRVLVRELEKLWYFITRGLLVFILVIVSGIIPFLPAIIGAVWAAWSMAIQYTDYAADNHQLRFRTLRNNLGHCMFSSIGFGGTVTFVSMVPIINIIAMPAAVTGGTVFWLNEADERTRRAFD